MLNIALPTNNIESNSIVYQRLALRGWLLPRDIHRSELDQLLNSCLYFKK